MYKVDLLYTHINICVKFHFYHQLYISHSHSEIFFYWKKKSENRLIFESAEALVRSDHSVVIGEVFLHRFLGKNPKITSVEEISINCKRFYTNRETHKKIECRGDTSIHLEHIINPVGIADNRIAMQFHDILIYFIIAHILSNYLDQSGDFIDTRKVFTKNFLLH